MKTLKYIFVFSILPTLLLLDLQISNAEPAASAIVFPLMSPRLSSNFGVRKHPVYKSRRHHSGVDLAAPERSHVRTIREGRVIFAGELGSYGKLVSVQHSGGYVSMYGHLSEYSVEIGQSVAAGEVIGLVGATGTATGPHLHLEWRKDGKALDPLEVFPELIKKAEG